MSERIQRRRAKGWRLPENSVCVDRSTPWGNPFVVGQDGTAEDCVRLYLHLLAGRVCLTAKAPPDRQMDHYRYVNANIEKLRGIRTFLELRRPPVDESKPLVSEDAWNALWRLQFGEEPQR